MPFTKSAPVETVQSGHVPDATRYVGIVPAFTAIALLAFFWSSPEGLYIAGLVAAAISIALVVGVANWIAPLRTRLARRAVTRQRMVVGVAALMGLVWATPPLVLFGGAEPDRRLLVVAAVVVAMTEVFRFGQSRSATLVYLLPICLGAVVGFGLTGSYAAWGLVGFVVVFAWLLLIHCARARIAVVRQAKDRSSIAGQNDVIEELLLDFDDAAADWIWRTNPDGRFVDILTGEGMADAVPIPGFEGQRFQELFRTVGLATAGAEVIAAAFAARRPFRHQLVEVRTQESRWLRLSGKPIFDAAGRFQGYRGVGSDITAVRMSESRITQLAKFDPLTGFANRAHFHEHASRQCAQASNDGICRALLSLDLDGFRTVNDRVGHEGGDDLLRHVAERLRKALPPGGFIARLGSDEFAVWLSPATPTKAEAAAQAFVDAIGSPFDIQGMRVDIGVSIGIVFAPKHARDPDDLLVKADLALYRAKNDGNEKICVFEPAFETALIERRKLYGDLKLALARGEFQLHYQPLLDVPSGRVVGFEALIRWHSPERGLVPPGDFIPAAEAMGLITPIGQWVLREACRTAASWPSHIHVAVNVSPPHVRSSEFLTDVREALRTSGLHPSRLEIEVTEGVFLDKSPAALEALRKLRTKGIRIALDDFGTGYSSLNYLVDFPVDKIKIDRVFIAALSDSPKNGAIVDAILSLAKKLSIRVNAEGIETKEQALALKRRRCDELQGYLFSRPRPAADVPAMIESVPAVFREAVPTYMDSPLAMAMTAKSATAG